MRFSISVALLSVLGVSALPTRRDPPGGGLHNPVEPPGGAVAVRNAGTPTPLTAANLVRVTRRQVDVDPGLGADDY
ncbi:uncharacterized protein C8A04DRAFT_29626 [Dichotomopilus funicola]|uniref:Uncharacterized protein n=1 Tax=Dichotomopilus funicola TaxID=1934379 RepID=A0AAN6ZLW0_9PEZI|nr:hypothetical protein C8A04DRAFT_29626 [Dichotomopilus funicola]